jgi:DNA-binding winged helix-turn-helix (wHTH) protein
MEILGARAAELPGPPSSLPEQALAKAGNSSSAAAGDSQVLFLNRAAERVRGSRGEGRPGPAALQDHQGADGTLPPCGFAFGPFHMDVAGHRLWRGRRDIRLRPKSWDVLLYLIRRAGLLVTRDAVHREIWRGAAVSDDTLTQSILELRRALGDSAKTPRFIETVHRRGFRFVAPVTSGAGEVPGSVASAETASWAAPAAVPRPAGPFEGRQPELTRLDECLSHAQSGARQVVFVTGEAGIGKTRLVTEFLRASSRRGGEVRVLHGQCIQQHGAREPYMPVLEALERVFRTPAGVALIPLFRRLAPNWYVQLPSLRSEAEPESVPFGPLQGAPERMLREIATFLEAMAGRSTVILVLEDLHWSDAATVDLLAYLAQRPDGARLLIIGTYRPAEAGIHDNPICEVKQILGLRRHSIELPLAYLSAADIREYLRARFGPSVQDLARVIHERTDGNPLFMVAVLDELIRRSLLAEADGRWTVRLPLEGKDLPVPADVREMIASKFRGLGAGDRALLEAASVAGMDFHTHILARAIARDPEEVDAAAQLMVWPHRILNGSSGPGDGARGTRYQFVHGLYHQVLYELVPAPRRRRLHQAMGEALESTAEGRAADIAPALSAHFESSGDLGRAVKYLAFCVDRAQHRFAHLDAITYAEHALGLLRRLPGTSDRDRQELELRLRLGLSLAATRGYASPETGDNYRRARSLGHAVGDARQLFEIVSALSYAQIDGTEEGFRRGLDELSGIVQRPDAADLRYQVDLLRGRIEFWVGNFGRAVRILSKHTSEEASRPVSPRLPIYGVHPVVGASAQYALALWFAGYPDQARAQADRGLAYAKQLGRPTDLASIVCHSAVLALLCGDTDRAGRLASGALALCADHGLAEFVGPGLLARGASLAEQGDARGGVAEMEQGLTEQRGTAGTFLCDVILAFLALGHARAGQWDEGLRRADEGLALSETRFERIYTAELWRVRGELLLGRAREAAGESPVGDAAELCFRRALEIARQQEARSLELRAAMSLARLQTVRAGRHEEARDLLRSVYASFTEGFDTKDLEDAKALLDKLGG